MSITVEGMYTPIYDKENSISVGGNPWRPFVLTEQSDIREDVFLNLLRGATAQPPSFQIKHHTYLDYLTEIKRPFSKVPQDVRDMLNKLESGSFELPFDENKSVWSRAEAEWINLNDATSVTENETAFLTFYKTIRDGSTFKNNDSQVELVRLFAAIDQDRLQIEAEKEKEEEQIVNEELHEQSSILEDASIDASEKNPSEGEIEPQENVEISTFSSTDENQVPEGEKTPRKRGRKKTIKEEG